MQHQIRWTLQKIKSRLALIEPLVHYQRWPVPAFRCQIIPNSQPNPPPLSKLDPGAWHTIEPGDYWLGPRTNFILQAPLKTPLEMGDGFHFALYLPLGDAGDFSHPEAMIYIDGQPLASCDRHHQEVLLTRDLCDGQVHDLLLYGWTGGTRKPESHLLQMKQSWLVQIHEGLRELIRTAIVASEIAEHLHEDNLIHHNLLTCLDETFKTLDTREPLGDAFYSSVPKALKILQDGLESSGPPQPVKISAIGHAHLDLAWLWTLAETRRKAGKTFINIIRLMEENDSFRFTQSQPQLYEFVREDYPELFEEIRHRVSSGQWELTGGMWVEADCNLTGAESLVRQLLLGRSFFRQNFGEGMESAVLWLPDVFGYTANLPQLIKKSGLEYFFTIKIGWNQYNRLPYDTFWWEGIDGTRVLTHFSPTKQPGSSMVSTYNADASPGQILSTWTNFQQKDLGKPGDPPPLLMSYGYGDGGGGPTREMLDNIKLFSSFPGAPQVRFATVNEFFSELEEAVGDRLPTWSGELYLEYHRGTYTTHGRNKRANRKSEFLLHDTEFLATLASLIAPDYEYPHDEFLSAWKLLCLNQFHDILPGSSIGEVYEESTQQYKELTTNVEQLQKQALDVIARSAPVNSSFILINPTSFPQDLPLLLKDDYSDDFRVVQSNSAVSAQKVDNGWLIDAGRLPPYSISTLEELGEAMPIGAGIVSDLAASPTLLENRYLRVELNDQGDIGRIFDKRYDREVIVEGKVANQFQLFEDRPRIPDAWDIDIFYDDQVWFADPATSITVKENGPLRASVEIQRAIFSSRITQTISLYRNCPLIVFDTRVDWVDRNVLLKVAFPVEVLSPHATYEIQWGNVERATHKNTSWDWAKFETCAHKWVDLSEGGYGVSLINDCKYGHDIHNNVIRLTLLRGTTDPDPTADLGLHNFSYALLPHPGSWDETTLAYAYALNDPSFVAPCEKKADTSRSSDICWAGNSLVQTRSPNIIIETIKMAEDGQGIIIRLYESMRIRGQVKVETMTPVVAAWRTDLLENNLESMQFIDNTIILPVDPFEIITLRIILEK